MPGLSKREKREHKKAAQPHPVLIRPKRQLRFTWLASLIRSLHSAISLPVTSYTAILLLQLKMVWGMWWYKDLTTGDTTQYFLNAVSWFETGHGSVLWSPMYSTFYGSLLHFTTDPYVVTILHRLIIVFVSALLVLALMRRLLPPGIAWMAAAWWVILPINFNALYEVHLFAVIPLLLGVLATLWIPSVQGRGMSAGILLLTGTLMRNEYLVAAALFTVLSLGWELLRTPREASRFKTLGLAFGLPILVVLVTILASFVRSKPAFSSEQLRAKQTLNVCQVYAAGYQQRASDFQGSPWTECDQLMNRDFGSADLTFMQAFLRNPRAMLEHVRWNITLIPAGLQVLLFNYRSGSANPDYAPTDQSDLVLIPTVLACMALAAGLVLWVRERKRWRTEWTEQRVWAGIALACTAVSVCAAMLSNRPRPSYMFIFGIGLRVVIAYCFYVIVSRWPNLRRAVAAISVVLVAALILKPSVYEQQRLSRPLLTATRRIQPAAAAFAEPNPLMVSTEFGTEITSYVGRCNCPAIRYDVLRKDVTKDFSLAQALATKGANLFYADELIMHDPVASQLVMNASAYHWRVVASGNSGAGNWAVLRKNL